MLELKPQSSIFQGSQLFQGQTSGNKNQVFFMEVIHAKQNSSHPSVQIQRWQGCTVAFYNYSTFLFWFQEKVLGCMSLWQKWPISQLKCCHFMSIQTLIIIFRLKFQVFGLNYCILGCIFPQRCPRRRVVFDVGSLYIY